MNKPKLRASEVEARLNQRFSGRITIEFLDRNDPEGYFSIMTDVWNADQLVTSALLELRREFDFVPDPGFRVELEAMADTVEENLASLKSERPVDSYEEWLRAHRTEVCETELATIRGTQQYWSWID